MEEVGVLDKSQGSTWGVFDLEALGLGGLDSQLDVTLSIVRVEKADVTMEGEEKRDMTIELLGEESLAFEVTAITTGLTDRVVLVIDMGVEGDREEETPNGFAVIDVVVQEIAADSERGGSSNRNFNFLASSGGNDDDDRGNGSGSRSARSGGVMDTNVLHCVKMGVERGS